jgi:concanavalin A-like lectin/glucanase superfamily protein
MSFLFDDASNQRISKTSVIGMYSCSIWFWPDDTTAVCTLYSEHNGTGSAYVRVYIQGSDDKVYFETKPPLGGSANVASGGTVSYNAWNHVYATRGANSPNHSYISLNGETLVDGGAGSYNASASQTATAIGVTGSATRTNYMSGRIAEVGIWDNSLSDEGDAYKMLSKGFDPRFARYVEFSFGAASLISYTPLLGNFADLVHGDVWNAVSAPLVAEHCRMHRNLLAA